MTSKPYTIVLYLLTCMILILTSCRLAVGLFYKDWRSETAYRSSSSKMNYFIIEGVTQSHCGCSDIVVRNYRNKKIDFKFYYGGGLFPAKKYVYQYHKNRIDTLVYIPVSTDNYNIQLDSLDKVVLRHIDTLITNRPKGSGLIYKVKQHTYKGFVREN